MSQTSTAWKIDNWQNDLGFTGVQRITYRTDIGEDWALAWPGERDVWVVVLHGHGSTGDQIFTRADVRDRWLQGYREMGFGVLSPNLRGNAWMSPEAVADLHRLLAWAREAYAISSYYLLSGSMGGTSNLIYGILHPEDVAAMSAFCSATDLASYTRWLADNPVGPYGIRDEIRQAIVSSYQGTPDEQPEKYTAHSALLHADRLTMPLIIGHGDDDVLIPVEQSRHLADTLKDKADFTYIELPGGDHDSPLFGCDLFGWLRKL